MTITLTAKDRDLIIRSLKAEKYKWKSAAKYRERAGGLVPVSECTERVLNIERLIGIVAGAKR